MSSDTITNEEIQKIALDNGFTTRRQPDGSIDLNPYVYSFARTLLQHEEAKEHGLAPEVDFNKPTLAVDFDGVLHRYDSDWQGADVIADGPVEGAMRFLTDATDKFNVCVYSTRSSEAGGIEAMYAWLQSHLNEYWEEMPEVAERVLSRLCFPLSKPKAVVYIDDRGHRFDGTWPDVDDLLQFKPWNKQ